MHISAFFLHNFEYKNVHILQIPAYLMELIPSRPVLVPFQQALQQQACASVNTLL